MSARDPLLTDDPYQTLAANVCRQAVLDWRATERHGLRGRKVRGLRGAVQLAMLDLDSDRPSMRQELTQWWQSREFEALVTVTLGCEPHEFLRRAGIRLEAG